MPELAKSLLCFDRSSEVDERWRWASHMDELKDHPGKGAAPLILFTDASEDHRNQEVMACLFQSMLRNSLNDPDLHSFVMLLVPLHLVDDVGLLFEELGDFFAWQQQVLLSGQWPSVGHYKEDFAEGSTRWNKRGFSIVPACKKYQSGTITGWHGDTKERKVVVPSGRSYMHTNICDNCLAQGPEVNSVEALCYMDLENPTCMQFKIDDRLAAKEMFGQHLRLLAVPFLSRACVFFDWPHLRWLGIDRDFAASALVVWLRYGTAQRFLAAKGVQAPKLRKSDNVLSMLWILVRSHLKAHGIAVEKRCPFTVSSLGLTQYNVDVFSLPSWVKAEHVKAIMFGLAYLAREMAPYRHDDPEAARTEALIELTLWSLSQLDALLARSGKWFTDSELQEFDRLFNIWRRSNQHLAVQFCDTKCFKLRPKSHYLLHISGNTHCEPG